MCENVVWSLFINAHKAATSGNTGRTYHELKKAGEAEAYETILKMEFGVPYEKISKVKKEISDARNAMTAASRAMYDAKRKYDNAMEHYNNLGKVTISVNM